MTEKYYETAIIIRQEELLPGINSMWIKTDKIAEVAKAGQFLNLYCKDKSRILPRPISICEIDKSDMAIRLVYRVIGEGTDEFSKLHTGDTIKVTGPLGNGFPIKQKHAIIIGGGIGIPPMLELAKTFPGEKDIVLGYSNELFLDGEFEKYGNVHIATVSGIYGTKGNVLDSIKENAISGDIIYACGPMPMLKAIKEYAESEEINIQCWLSLEERMACGIGACLGCMTKSKNKDAHTQVNNKRICTEGPVFLSKEVVM
ncbi:dihydroorotate dehydrogenase electron transfer subunit [Acetitomaculum ruminis DSM 5522]|uniref:Dihydroorotate dehydrogenase B (NAD(+)), electron transfer subunit n=1 Tax=Acetitomaculum ruminis DSM 5522 TaxID=1120918 RepID=A0A1I0V922_9FIRM|nr:dihydroorotate dehydrogenase electron transfer subunit [Acetitomaculum ruminis]SFA72543.1 dihydroorotate dehydrogenase electron transfer subunit [Acetitomaculum ruminis DSM 5522]